MDQSKSSFPSCPLHGKPTKRQSCRQCNAAYMRGYLRRRRHEQPDRSLWDRAYKRARSRGIGFSLAKGSINIPPTCPVLGTKIEFRGARSACSPSLDRVVPARGYISGNVRVICDRANRLKGDRSLKEIQRLADSGPIAFRDDYRMIATYMERELLLDEVRCKAAKGGRAGEEWAKIAEFLDRVFSQSILAREG